MTTHRRFARLLLLAASASAAGCGAEAYQSRIEGNSIPFFGYQGELESSLGPWWRKGEIRIRLPKTFKEVPAPKKKPGSTAVVGRDPRLPPEFVGQELPGLLGGFRGTMRAELAGGKTAEVPVFAFVLSNRYLLASREPTAKPQAYDTALLTSVGLGLNKGAVATTGLKPFVPTENVAPDQRAFASAPRYDRMSFDATTAAAPMKYEVFIRRQPPLQVGVVFVVPKEAARDEQLKKRLDLSLQTLRVEPGGAAAPGGPAQQTF